MNSSIWPTRDALPARLEASGAALTKAVKEPVRPPMTDVSCVMDSAKSAGE